MRFLAFIIGLTCSLAVYAQGVLLTQIFTPKPEYPQQLIDSRYTGKVRASPTIGPDGSVQNVRIVESPHPQLAEAVRDSMILWSYKPRIEAADAPASITIMMPVIFGPGGGRPFSNEVSIGLRNIPCAHLNDEVANSTLECLCAIAAFDVLRYSAGIFPA
ncbi:energy transducer TonB [Pseudomonas sp. NA-150]|uniref:energy transducer TonB n=1 Tax=Pseudomonas sp. NA-150 TaxID=3367525 RepID=UPI0037C519A3